MIFENMDCGRTIFLPCLGSHMCAYPCITCDLLSFFPAHPKGYFVMIFENMDCGRTSSYLVWGPICVHIPVSHVISIFFKAIFVWVGELMS